jgi:hypothetical protein
VAAAPRDEPRGLLVGRPSRPAGNRPTLSDHPRLHGRRQRADQPDLGVGRPGPRLELGALQPRRQLLGRPRLGYIWADGYTLEKYQTVLQLAGDKPIAIGECEVLPTADELAAQPRWTFFMAWAELVQTANSVQQIQVLYNAANVITLDQMPGWG